MNKKIITERVKELLEKLTLKEKIGMIHGAELFQTKGVERLGIPPLKMSDGPMGVRQEFAGDCWETIGKSEDFVTYLPCPAALAATWNRQLAYEAGSVLGAEARGRGKDVILAPGINIKRSPLCGRNFEYFSEDPYMTGQMAIPFVKGIQSWDVAACVKHFAVNNQETDRLWVDVQIDDDILRHIYLPAFHDALVDGGAYAVMGAYNRVRGEHCCESKFLLNDVLRKEWGYDGVVISDWGAVHNTKQAANSQLDIEMSVTNDFNQYYMADPLKKLVEEGEVSESVIDEKVARILILMTRLHMMDGSRKAGTYNAMEHQRTVLEVARESIVLLKNEENSLPIRTDSVKKILIVGENAERIHSNGGGSSEIKALYEITPLLGIKKLLGGNTQVDFVQGYCSDETHESQNLNWQETSLENGGGQTAVSNDRCSQIQKRAKLRTEAVRAAADYEQVIFIGGLNHEYDCEGNDRSDMKLPYEQDLLIQKLLQVKPDMKIVMIAGSPVEMKSWIKSAKSVVWCWYGGMEGGTALAEVLLGLANPSGKLPETFYKSHMDCSAHCVGEFPGDKTVRYREGKLVGYRYQESCGLEPEFCFGHGLSYSHFSYTEANLESIDGKWFVNCKIKNAGLQKGAEVVQIYAEQPEKELIGFEKVTIEAGASETVRVELSGYQQGNPIAVGRSLKDICIWL